MIIRTLIFLSLGTIVTAQDPVQKLLLEFDTQLKKMEAGVQLRRQQLGSRYRKALENLTPEAQQTGELAYVEEIQKEIARISSGVTAPESFSGRERIRGYQEILKEELDKLRLERATRLVSLHTALESKLADFQATQVKQGRIEQAKATAGLRETRGSSPDFEEAKRLLQANAATVPPTIDRPKAYALKRKVETRLNGKISRYEVRTGEIEILYDFSDNSQLSDFEILLKDVWRIRNSSLIAEVPPKTDWWLKIPINRTPYLVIPFMDSSDVEIEVTLEEMEMKGQAHFALGWSDLKDRTIAFGPLFLNKQFTLQGWTPSNPELRGRSSSVPNRYPATLVMQRKGERISFRVRSGNRFGDLDVETTDELNAPGFYPKAIGDVGLKVRLDNLIIRGRVNPDYFSR